MRGFEFNQKKGSLECAWRCIYSVLVTLDRHECSYKAFLKKMRSRKVDRLYANQVDVYTTLAEHGIVFGVSFPTPTGTYMIFYPAAPNMWHAILYHQGKVYDSESDQPHEVPVRRLIHKIRPKGKPSIYQGLICIEIFGVEDSDMEWKEKKSNSKSNRILTRTKCCPKASSLTIASSIGASMKRLTGRLWQWVRSFTGPFKPMSPSTSLNPSRNL